MTAEENMQLMTTLDEAWNAQDWDTFEKRHSTNTAVYWPGQPEPTRGRPDHKAEAVEFFKTFPDNHLDLPYKVLIGYGDWTCSVARFTGPMKGADGKEIPPQTRASKSSSVQSPSGRTARSLKRSSSTTWSA